MKTVQITEELITLKIAVSSSSDAGLESFIDPRFGRCAFYTIIEVHAGKVTNVKSLSNTAATEFFIAGVQTIEMLVKCDVNTVITGNLGPKSFYGLRDAGIPAYGVKEGILVSKAIEMFLQDKLSLITELGAPHMGKSAVWDRTRKNKV